MVEDHKEFCRTSVTRVKELTQVHVCTVYVSVSPLTSFLLGSNVNEKSFDLKEGI